ncbi:MAG: stage III sporulation protein AB [Oscillospiraceae bacterium]|nr:stage III sporulation protein AB [Oscillospiraceae bacterium]
MDKTIALINRFDEAVELLPYQLRGPARLVDEMDKARTEEFRLRLGQVPSLVLPEGERPFASSNITSKELTAVLEIAAGASVHAVRDSLRQGYITARGGCRVGLGGQAAVREGEVCGFTHLGSAAIRITKEILGVADAILPQLKERGTLQSTLILSPPGGGKTTVLRDIVRQCSDGGRRCAVADERGELAALKDGRPQMDLGSRTDVMAGCPKDKAVLMLLRAMNPEVIAMDEITAPADTQALESAANCGVTLLATAHGHGLDDLLRKPMYRKLLRKGLFTRLVTIDQGPSGRSYAVKDLGEVLC